MVICASCGWGVCCNWEISTLLLSVMGFSVDGVMDVLVLPHVSPSSSFLHAFSCTLSFLSQRNLTGTPENKVILSLPRYQVNKPSQAHLSWLEQDILDISLLF